MLYNARISVFEGIDVNKTSVLKECIICNYWYFEIKDLSFNNPSVMVVIMHEICLLK